MVFPRTPPADPLAYDPKLYALLGGVFADDRIPRDVHRQKDIPPPQPSGAAGVVAPAVSTPPPPLR